MQGPTVASTSLQMSSTASSLRSTAQLAIDEAVLAVLDHAREFARLGTTAKAALIRACIPRLLAEAPAWVEEGSRMRGADPGEEWLGGPSPTIRAFRLLAESLETITTKGKPPLGRGVRTRADGRIEIDLFPASALDSIAFQGFHGYALMEAGITEERARERQASFYSRREPEGGVAVILGAGNVSSIPPMDVATKMFAEGYVCVLKMNPVNEWVGPYLERALHPFISRGYLRIVYGGGDVGAYLTSHPLINDVHITGSDRTHDLIVWGPPGPDRDRRLRERDPLLKVPISSELGNVSPVAVVPEQYSDHELWFMARNVVSMVFNNGSFNCNAAKMLITAQGWPQRNQFLDLVAKGLSEAPTRKAYYPGAFDRYSALTATHHAERFGTATDQNLAWAFMRGLDATADDVLFRTEPFCGVLSETSLSGSDPARFLLDAATFMNDRLWGTLNAMFFLHPKTESQPAVAAALDRALLDLRYGTVSINHWPALCYAWGTMPWGGHQSSTLQNIQSGLGWVHNTYLLEGIDKSVVRGPLTVSPYPMWFFDNPKTAKVGPVMADMEASPSWLKLPGLLLKVLT